MKLRSLIIFIGAASLLWSCVNNNNDKEEKEEEEVENTTLEEEFDLKGILVNAADNIIIPQLEDLSNSTKEIKDAFITFNSDPSSDNLNSLQSKYKTSYLNWQACSFINFGDDSFEYLAFTLNTFPVKTDNLNSFFTKPEDNLEWAMYYDSRGYPGLDYVLFDGSEDNIIARISNTGYDYCTKNIDLINSKSENAYSYWKNNTEGYYNEFKTDDSKTITSAFTKYVNAFCKDLEVLKNEQLKAPGGQEFFPFPEPSQSEALYSGYSLDLFKAHLANLERIYKGEDLSGNNGIGFDDYLVSLGTKRDNDNLNDLILTTFNTLEEKVNLLNGSINDAAANQKGIVDELYANVKKLVGYTKTDMTYAFGVNINYADPQDGD